MTHIPDEVKQSFMKAVEAEDLGAARQLLVQYPGLLQKDLYPCPPLCVAMTKPASAHLFAALFLEEAGATEEMIADMMWYPMEGYNTKTHVLHRALERPLNEDAALLILKHDQNLDVNHTSTATQIYFGSILHRALDNGFAAAAKIIIDKGGDIYGVDREKMNGLHHAARGNTATVDLAYSYLKDRIDEKDEDGATAFARAVEKYNFETVHRLKELGADIHLTIYKGNNTLMWAAKGKKSPEMVETLIGLGLSVSTKDDDGRCAMHYFADGFNAFNMEVEATLEKLLAAKGDVNARDNEEKTPLMIAAEKRHYAQIMALFAKNADPTLIDIHGNNAAFYSDMKDIFEKEEKRWAETVLVEHEKRRVNIVDLYTKGTSDKMMIKASRISLRTR